MDITQILAVGLAVASVDLFIVLVGSLLPKKEFTSFPTPIRW